MYKSITKVSMMQTLYKSVTYVVSSKEVSDPVTVILNQRQKKKKSLKKHNFNVLLSENFYKAHILEPGTHTEHLTKFNVKIN